MQGQRVLQAGHTGQRQYHHGRQGAGQRMLGATIELQGGAAEVRPFRRGIVEVMGQRSRMEQQAGFLDAQAQRRAAAGAVRDFHGAAPHHMQKELSDGDVPALRAAGFSDGEVVEILAHLALNLFTNYVNVAFAVPVDFPQIKLKRDA